jgi:hypothetical protein
MVKSMSLLLPILAQLNVPNIIPVNNQTVNFSQFVTDAVDQLVNTYSGLFVSTVQPYLTPALLAGIVISGLFWMFDYPTRAMQYLFRTLIAYVAVVWMLRYYIVPMPLVGIPFSQIFRMEGRFLSGMIDIGLLNVFIQNVAAFMSGDKPNPLNFFGVISYFLILTSLALPEIVLFLETSFAIVALGIGALLGPIFIALYMLPFSWAKQLFWAWFHAMIKYAFYRVFASALVFIWATAEMAFITQMFGGKLSFGSWSASILGLLVFNVACGILCLRLPRLVSDFTGGSASAGGGMTMAAVTVGSRFL